SPSISLVVSGGTTSPLTVTGSFVQGQAYTIQIAAVNSVGTGTYSAASNSITPYAVGVAGAPTIGVATATGATTATVAFTAPASNGGSTITSYTVTSSPAGGAGSLTQAGSGTISVTGLTTGTAYTFTVHATNGNGDSAESGASGSITTWATPAAPTIGTATVTNSTTISVPFTAGASNGSTITSYVATSSPSISLVVSGGTTSPLTVK